MKTCGAKTRSGGRCQAPAVGGGDFCYWHAPHLRNEVREAQSRGGKNKTRASITGGEVLPLETAEDVKRALAQIVNEVRAGSLDFRLGNACFVGLSTFLRALDQANVEAELAALWAEVESMKGLKATG